MFSKARNHESAISQPLESPDNDNMIEPADSTFDGSIRISSRFHRIENFIEPDTTKDPHEPPSSTLEDYQIPRRFNICDRCLLASTDSSSYDTDEDDPDAHLISTSYKEILPKQNNHSSVESYLNDHKTFSDQTRNFFRVNPPTSVIHHHSSNNDVCNDNKNPFINWPSANHIRSCNINHNPVSPTRNQREFQINSFNNLNQSQKMESDPFFDKFTSLCLRTRSPFVAPNLYPFSQPKKGTDVSNQNY